LFGFGAQTGQKLAPKPSFPTHRCTLQPHLFSAMPSNIRVGCRVSTAVGPFMEDPAAAMNPSRRTRPSSLFWSGFEVGHIRNKPLVCLLGQHPEGFRSFLQCSTHGRKRYASVYRRGGL